MTRRTKFSPHEKDTFDCEYNILCRFIYVRSCSSLKNTKTTDFEGKKVYFYRTNDIRKKKCSRLN